MVPDDPERDRNEVVENDSSRFDRLPATADERAIQRRPTRAEILSWFEDRFGIDPDVFADHTFWERGTGKIWVFRGEAPSPAEVEALGMLAVRTRREHWKPTLEAVQRFGDHATRNRIHLSRAEAARFLAGEDQSIDWDGDWGYLVVTHDLAGESAPVGVGLYVYGELRSMVPKGRRREL
jgi:NOL1/NOP2/fmu family ribosome biogenesis protein